MLKNSTHNIYPPNEEFYIHKTKNCYQHHIYYQNDIDNSCKNNNSSNKTKQNTPHKKRKRTRNRRSRKKANITKYINNKNSIENKSSNIKCKINNIHNITRTINETNKVWYCTNYTQFYKVNLKIRYKINRHLKHIGVYLKKKFNILQLVLIIIILALITCTAQRIDNAVKSQQTPTTSPIVLAARNADSGAVINFNKSLHNIHCHLHHVKNTPQRAKADVDLTYQTHVCHHLRLLFYRYLKSQTQLKLNFQKHLQKLITYNISSSKRLINNMNKRHQINLYNTKYSIQVHRQHYIKNNEHDDHYYHDNDSALLIRKQQHIPNKNDKVKINIENKRFDEVGEQQLQKKRKLRRESNNTNNRNKFYPNIITNKYLKNNSYNANYNYEMKPKTENVNNNVVITQARKLKYSRHKQADVHNNYNHAEISYSESSFNLLLNDNHSTPHIDNNKLMELVMNGLGLKEIPKMETVNISQEEYVTKYREYLQRIHARERVELPYSSYVFDDYDKKCFKQLEIFTIMSNTTLISHYEEYQKPNNASHLARQRRNAFEPSYDNAEHDNPEYDNDEKKHQNLEERVRNVFSFKKKHLIPRNTQKEREQRITNIQLLFALKPEILNLSSTDIEEANVRLVLIYSPTLAVRNSKNKKTHAKSRSKSCGNSKSEAKRNSPQTNELNMKLFFISKHGKRILLDERKVDIFVDFTKPDETHTQWLQFDVSKAVKITIDDKHQQHIVLELKCDNCKRFGGRILNDGYDTAVDALSHEPSAEDHQLMPVLNIIGHFDQSQYSMRPHKYEKQHRKASEETMTQHRYHHHQPYVNNNSRHNRRTYCYKTNQRCCRHSMEVTFKEIKGFEFIIQPKVFDAGYCHGRCPPRYNSAHHHALLQSLIWKQNHKKAPRPCCAPSKLVELEVLHVDEKDSEKLKISTWSDMKVVECACS